MNSRIAVIGNIRVFGYKEFAGSKNCITIAQTRQDSQEIIHNLTRLASASDGWDHDSHYFVATQAAVKYQEKNGIKMDPEMFQEVMDALEYVTKIMV